MERQQMFEAILPGWEGRIWNVALLTLQTKTIDTHLDIQDICNQLRWYMWKAVESWKEDGGMSLSSWIFQAIKQGRGLIIEANYNCLPRDEYGKVLYPESTDATIESEDGNPIKVDVEDTQATKTVTEFIEGEEDNRIVGIIDLAIGTEWERKVFSMIIDNNHESDQEIANREGVDFAKIAEVRMKSKILFALLHNIPLKRFTLAKNSGKLTEVLYTRLCSTHPELVETINLETILS